MTPQDLALKQLERLDAHVQSDKTTSRTIRSWCVTVWAAATTVILTGRIELEGFALLFLMLAPVLMFWLLDGIQHAFIVNHLSVSDRIEEYLISNTLQPKGDIDAAVLPLAISFKTDRLSFRQKISLMLDALFFRETLISFYLIMAVSTFVAYAFIPRSVSC